MGRTRHPPLAYLRLRNCAPPERRSSGSRRLGDNYLQATVPAADRPAPPRRDQRRVSVDTASAITTSFTAPRLEHGLTGWFTYFSERLLGAPLALPAPRRANIAGVKPERLFVERSLFDGWR